MRRGNLTPWGLSPRMVQALDAIVAHSSNKLAARALGVSPRTVEVLLASVRNRIQDREGERPFSRVSLLALWIKYRAGQYYGKPAPAPEGLARCRIVPTPVSDPIDGVVNNQ